MLNQIFPYYIPFYYPIYIYIYISNNYQIFGGESFHNALSLARKQNDMFIFV